MLVVCYLAVNQLSLWFVRLINLILAGSTLMVAVNGLNIITALSEYERMKFIKRIKNTLVFLAIAVSLRVIIGFIREHYS